MINSIYEEIIDPHNFIKNFDSEASFKNWLWLKTSEDLKHTLLAFEKSEMYEVCIIIKSVINQKSIKLLN